MGSLQQLKVPGDQVQPGDLYRFRMSKYDPIRWLKVLSVAPFRSANSVGKTVTIHLEHGCQDSRSISSRSDFATIKRMEVN